MKKPKYDPENVPLFEAIAIIGGVEWRNVSCAPYTGFLHIREHDNGLFQIYVSTTREELLGVPSSSHDKEFPDLDSAVDYCFEHGLVLV